MARRSTDGVDQVTNDFKDVLLSVLNGAAIGTLDMDEARETMAFAVFYAEQAASAIKAHRQAEAAMLSMRSAPASMPTDEYHGARQ